jgi:hypothetical protein
MILVPMFTQFKLGNETNAVIQTLLRSIYFWVTAIFIVLMFFLTISYDILLNYKTYLRCGLKKLWKTDNHWFRFEFFVVGGLITVPFWILYQIVILTYYNKVGRDLFYYFLTFFYETMIHIQQCVFPLAVTIVSVIARKVRKNRLVDIATSRSILTNLMMKQQGYDLFYKFCTKGKDPTI